MAFSVEDGTGKADANAYASVEFVDAYHTDRGNSGWAGTEEQKQQWIVKATDYVEGLYGTRFVGHRSKNTQALHFPADRAYDADWCLVAKSNEVPAVLQRVVAEYADRARQAELVPDPPSPVASSQGAGAGFVTKTTDKVGPIEEIRHYLSPKDLAAAAPHKSSTVSPHNLPEYPKPDLMVQRLLRSGTVRDLFKA